MELLNSSDFESIIDKKKVNLFTLKNSNQLTAQITNYGGRVVSLWTPDKDGNFSDIVLGYNSIKDYITKDDAFFGALIGRYGNRIAHGKFSIENKKYTLTTNLGEHHLHGGQTGFHNVVWDAEQVSESKLELKYHSKDGEEGYPGNLNVKVIYELSEKNELIIDYTATTDKTTHVNLTHHSYFNLLGAGNGSIDNHILQLNASSVTPVNKSMIPTGEIKSVENSPLDFSKPKKIGIDINTDNEQLKFGSGYDHNYVCDGSGLRKIAKVAEQSLGRTLEVYTTEPGVQFYSGNHLNVRKGKKKKSYLKRSGFCLETQHFPDTPNNKHFPSTILNPNEVYKSLCIYKFDIYKEDFL